MPKIIREKYENGVLVERQTEGSNTTPWHWLMLVVHSVIAICLVALVIISVHDSLALRASHAEEEASPASCEPPGCGRSVIHRPLPTCHVRLMPPALTNVEI